jgi:flagellar biosynthesis anti-sigma factor FlgM
VKINSETPGGLTGATDPLGRTPDAAATSGGKTPASVKQKDQLTVSPEARQLQAAAAEPPAVRPDVVARMRELLNQGQVGNDPAALADSIIDDWLDKP